MDKLALYNDALLLTGQIPLSGLTEAVEARYYLDSVWNMGAVEYCLEIVKPSFSTKTVKLNTPAVSTQHDLDSVHTLPADFIVEREAYSDSKLDQPISRYIVEDRKLACEYATIFLRYVSSDYVTTFTAWTASFARVVSAYLAREIAGKVNPIVLDQINALFIDRVKATLEIEAEKEPETRSAASTTTLTPELMAVYNDALLIMGVRQKIVSVTDDSNRRAILDTAWNAGIVKDLLEDTAWTFALTSTQVQSDPSLAPKWGYAYAMKAPADMLRIDGIYFDEYMSSAIRRYIYEDRTFYTDVTIIYIQFVSSTWESRVAEWPISFRRLVAAQLARDASASLVDEGADVKKAIFEHETRRSAAKSNDAISAPPRIIASGSWVGSRGGRYERIEKGRLIR